MARINHMVYQAVKSEDAVDLDAVFGALAHEGRRAVLAELAKADAPTAMKALAERTRMSPQLMNKHAASLERAGLISRRAHGRETQAVAHPEVLNAAKGWIEEMTEYWNGQLDALGRYLDSLDADGRQG
jgi:DNA-binding transcriptional ArsR family regulator